jgi:hypothetical protein
MTIKLELTEQDIQILSAALGKLPYEVVVPLINKLNTQIAEQQVKE